MSTYLTDDRDSALKAGYRAAMLTPDVNEFLPEDMTIDEMATSLRNWNINGVARDNNTIGMAISKDGECHFCIEPEFQGRWLTKGILKEISEKIDCRYTTVNNKNIKKQDFVKKMGFEQYDVLGDDIVYKLRKLKWV